MSTATPLPPPAPAAAEGDVVSILIVGGRLAPALERKAETSFDSKWKSRVPEGTRAARRRQKPLKKALPVAIVVAAFLEARDSIFVYLAYPGCRKVAQLAQLAQLAVRSV